MNLLMPNFYNAAQLLVAALQQAGTVEDVDKIIKVLENIKYTGIFGTIRWVGKETYGINHQILHDMYVGKIVGGKCQIIDILKAN